MTHPGFCDGHTMDTCHTRTTRRLVKFLSVVIGRLRSYVSVCVDYYLYNIEKSNVSPIGD